LTFLFFFEVEVLILVRVLCKYKIGLNYAGRLMVSNNAYSKILVWFLVLSTLPPVFQFGNNLKYVTNAPGFGS